MQLAKHYEKLLLRAEETANRLGLNQDENIVDSRNPTKDEIVQLINSDITNIGELYKNCLYVNRVWQALKQHKLNTGVITIGYLKYAGDNEFYHTKKYLKDELASPESGGLKVHVWLTFPDGVIFDPTFMVMVHKENGVDLNKLNLAQVMVYDQVGIPSSRISMEYVPTLTGSDFLFRVGAIGEDKGRAQQHGIDMAEQCFEQALKAGRVVKLFDFIQHYKSEHPDEYPHIVKGFTLRMKKYLSAGLVIQYERKGSTEHTQYVHENFKHLIRAVPDTVAPLPV